MTAPGTQPAPASGEGEALRRQRANRIALWRSQILADRDDLTPLAPLLDAFEADVRAEASDEARETVRRVELVLKDPADAWWHTGGTPCVPKRAIAAALGGEQAGDGGREGL